VDLVVIMAVDSPRRLVEARRAIPLIKGMRWADAGQRDVRQRVGPATVGSFAAFGGPAVGVWDSSPRAKLRKGVAFAFLHCVCSKTT
jgi:hypothetical protein